MNQKCKNEKACRSLKAILLFQKIIIIVFLFCSQTINAEPYIIRKKIDLEMKQASLIEVLREIEKKTGYNFFYNEATIASNKKYDINFKNEPIPVILKTILSDSKLTYNIINNYIVITAIDTEEFDTKEKVIRKKAVRVKVEGTVVDVDNIPLIGVNIRLKGNTSVGTISNLNGQFTITVPLHSVLECTHIGFVTQEVTVNSGTMNIKMRESINSLNEVAVIGYGAVKKSDLTGAVGIVSVEDIVKAPVPNIDQALAGRIAGVQVSSGDGQPGSLSDIVIRGGNSVTQSNSPLFVIDGFPYESLDESPVGINDIETMQVLKDASSTAIYGARGANGVIIITTKQAKAGLPVITFNSYYGFQRNTKYMEMMNPYEFVSLQNEINPLKTASLYLENRTLDDYRTMKGVDMQRHLYRTAAIQSYDLSIRGGSDKTRYAVFGNYLSQDGLIINSGHDRKQIRFTLSQKIGKKMNLFLSSSYSDNESYGTTAAEHAQGIASLNIIYSTLGYRPIAGIDDVDLLTDIFDPVLEETDYRVNPIISVKNEINKKKTNITNVRATLDYDIIKDLRLKITTGLTNSNFEEKKFYNSKTQQGNTKNHNVTKGISGSIFNTNSQNILNENTLNYSKRIGENRFTALGGITFQTNKRIYTGYNAYFLPDDLLGIDGLDQSTVIEPKTYQKEWALASFLGRINYDYDSRYLFTLSFRADGSSKFMKKNRWGYFPSGAFAWRMSQEKFMKKYDFVSDAKLRLSAGSTGNNRVDEYAAHSSLIFDYWTYYSFNNSVPVRGAKLEGLGNPELKWETTNQIDIGYDLGLFDQRVQLTLDYYYKVTKDLLINAQLPHTSGYLSAYKNIGEINNQGFEITLNTHNIETKDFSWSTNFNISFNKNKVVELADDQSFINQRVGSFGDFSNIALYLAKVGHPMGQMYGYIYDGLYQYDDFDKLADGTFLLKSNVPNNTRARNTIRPGDVKLKDLNNDGVVDDNDRTVIGNGIPKHIGGFTNNFRYKSFDLNVFFQWSYGNDVANANRLIFEQNSYNSYSLNMYKYVVNRWTLENPNTDVARQGSIPPRVYHSKFIENGSFLRLKTVSLGYMLPDTFLSKFRVKSARVYVSGQNLWTWSNYSGQDPEVSVRHSALTPGYDWSSYPRARTFSFGLNVTL